MTLQCDRAKYRVDAKDAIGSLICDAGTGRCGENKGLNVRVRVLRVVRFNLNMVKTTKRTGARAVLLAVASAAVMARGAVAALSAGGCGSALIQGLAELGGGFTEDDCRDCITADGFYVKTAASDEDCTNLELVRAPAGWFSLGGGIVGGINVEEVPHTAAELTALDKSGASFLIANGGNALTILGACVVTFSDASVTPDLVTSPEGSRTSAACVTKPGVGITTKSDIDGSVVVGTVTGGNYAPGGAVLKGSESSDDNGIAECPENSDSAAGSTALADCECAANFYPSNNACVACATGTTREGTVSVTGTATCSTAAPPDSSSAAPPDSAGATAPIAVALAAAAAVPLLL